MYAHDTTLNNLVNGLMTRLFQVKDGRGGYRPTPIPTRGAWKSQMEQVLRRLKRHLPRLSPWTREQFVDSYQGDPRQARYQQAATDLQYRSVSVKDSYIDVFIKTEKLYKARADARLIQPRSARYNVEVGRFIKQAEPLIPPAIARLWGQAHVVTKGLNARDVGRLCNNLWTSYDDPVAVGLDASRFDQHTSVQALRWEHRVYDTIFSGNPELRRLLSWQLLNRGRGRTADGYSVSYERKGSRMSGDMNTGIGNCLIMSCMVWAYAKAHGLNCSLINNGDDCVLFLERNQLPKLESVAGWFARLGYTMEVEEPVGDLEAVEFCRTHPVFTENGWTMVRNFPTSMSRDAVVLKRLPTTASYGHWLYSVGVGGEALASGVPVLQAYYQMLTGTARLINPEARLISDATLRSGMARMSRGLTRHATTVSDDSRVSFALAFGVSPDDQICLERCFTPHFSNTHQMMGHPEDGVWTSTARFQYVV